MKKQCVLKAMVYARVVSDHLGQISWTPVGIYSFIYLFFSWLLLRKIERALYNDKGDCLVVFSSPIGIKDSNEAEL